MIGEPASSRSLRPCCVEPDVTLRNTARYQK